MKKIGEIAEELVLDFEIKRLKDKGFSTESKNVRRISQNHANAGYDIESFNEKSDNINKPDRLIEVKGSTGAEFDIHWSQNEVAQAKDNSDKYFLYYVFEIDIIRRMSPHKPIIIPDPFHNILENSEYDKVIESYHITRNSNSKE